jgi:hypothetical protein
LLNQALRQEPIAASRQALAQGLAAVAARLGSAARVRIGTEAAQTLNQSLARVKDDTARNQLTAGLVAVTDLLEPAEAARMLNQALASETENNARHALVERMIALAGRMNADEAAHVCAESARVLSQALAREKDSSARVELATDLAAVARRLEPAEEAHVCEEATRSFLQRSNLELDEDTLKLVSRLIQPLDREAATNTARIFSLRMVSDPDLLRSRAPGFPGGQPSGGPVSGALMLDVLERFLTNAPRPWTQRRATALAAGIGISANGSALSLTLLPAASEPLPGRLTTQDLVELLKMPTCVSEVRRVILDQLGNRFGRRFDTHWDFVRYAQDHGLNLDFTTPPQRPDRKLPPLFAE